MNLGDHVTPEEATLLLRHTLDTVQRWCRLRELTATRVGRRFFIHRDEIARFIAHGPAVARVRKVRKVKPKQPTKGVVPSGARKGATHPVKHTSKHLRQTRPAVATV